MSDISRLKIRGTEYTLKDAVARGEETETDNSVSSISVGGTVYDVKDLVARGEGEPAANEISKVSVGGKVYQIKDATARVVEYAYYFAVFSDDDSSLTFYGDNTVPDEGDQYKGKTASMVYTDLEDKQWEGDMIITAKFDESFAGARPTSCHSWFEAAFDCRSIDGLKNLNTSSVTDMGQMFQDCPLLTTLDVSGWDTSSVTDMRYMFEGCVSLTTIYSNDDKFVTTKVTSDNNMFQACESLVGGNGTRFDDSKVTSDMAHVDTADNPGYFTGK